MLILSTVLTLALACAAATALVVWTWRPIVRHQVLVVLDDESGLQGIVTSRRGPLLIMSGVTVHHEGKTSPAEGQVVVERSRVRWIQVTAS